MTNTSDIGQTPAKKPARSKTKAATTRPRAARKTVNSKNKITENRTPEVVPKTLPSIAPVISSKSEDQDANKEIKKGEILDRLVARTGMKKGDARSALDAVLGVLGEALDEGADMSLAPLGKIKIARTKDTPNGKMVVCRVKLKPTSSS